MTWLTGSKKGPLRLVSSWQPSPSPIRHKLKTPVPHRATCRPPHANFTRRGALRDITNKISPLSRGEKKKEKEKERAEKVTKFAGVPILSRCSHQKHRNTLLLEKRQKQSKNRVGQFREPIKRGSSPLSALSTRTCFIFFHFLSSSSVSLPSLSLSRAQTPPANSGSIDSASDWVSEHIKKRAFLISFPAKATVLPWAFAPFFLSLYQLSGYKEEKSPPPPLLFPSFLLFQVRLRSRSSFLLSLRRSMEKLIPNCVSRTLPSRWVPESLFLHSTLLLCFSPFLCSKSSITLKNFTPVTLVVDFPLCLKLLFNLTNRG